MHYTVIDYEVDKQIATITLDRPSVAQRWHGRDGRPDHPTGRRSRCRRLGASSDLHRSRSGLLRRSRPVGWYDDIQPRWNIRGQPFPRLGRSAHVAAPWGDQASDRGNQRAPVSAVIICQMLWRMLCASHPMEAHRVVDSLAISQTGQMADAAEGISAFLEKRPASWTLAPSRDTPDWYPWWTEPSYEH